MTVHELIQELQKHHPDSEVILSSDLWPTPIKEIRLGEADDVYPGAIYFH